MHLFLAAAFIFSSLILVLSFKINDFIIRKKKIPKDKRYKFIKNRLLMNIVVSCIIFIFIFRGIPSLIWHLADKETNNIEKVEIRKNMYAISENDSSMYAGLTTVKGKEKYAFRYEGQLDTSAELVDFKGVEVVEIPASEVPHYEKIVQYKRSRLKDKGLLTACVNNMYSEIDSVVDIKKNTKDWKEAVIGEKVKLYIPKDSIKKDYKLK
jgi:hypothetical protein